MFRVLFFISALIVFCLPLKHYAQLFSRAGQELSESCPGT